MVFFGIEMILRIGGRGIPFLLPVYELFTEIISSLHRKSSLFILFLVGVFNALLPCPLVYAFLMKSASTFNPLKGLEVMLVMGIGTFPAMFISGSLLLQKKRVWFRKEGALVAGLMIVYLGIVSVLRGFWAF